MKKAKWFILISAVLLHGLCLSSVLHAQDREKIFNQQYSKQEIQNVVNHFKKYDRKLNDHFIMHKAP